MLLKTSTNNNPRKTQMNIKKLSSEQLQQLREIKKRLDKLEKSNNEMLRFLESRLAEQVA